MAGSDHDLIYRVLEGFKKILESKNHIICPSVMMKREVNGAVGLYSTEFSDAGYFYQWFEISQKFDIAYIAGAIFSTDKVSIQNPFNSSTKPVWGMLISTKSISG